MMLWTMDPAARDAKLAHKALKKKGDRHVWVLIEVACASSPDHLVAVRKAYCAAYSASLEEDVAACPLYKDPLKQASPPVPSACAGQIDPDISFLAILAAVAHLRRCLLWRSSWCGS
jgi:hypothetical protein